MSNRLLVPVDFSECSEDALEQALRLIHEDDALVLVHVYEPPRFTRPDLVAWAELDGKMMPLAQVVKKEAQQKLEALISQLRERREIKIESTVVEGRAAKSIVAAVDEHNCNMIVIGTRGRSGASRLVLGSVAEAVVRSARCPVLTVPPRRAD